MENNNNKNLSPLLDIFYNQKNRLNLIIPIIKNTDKIKDLILFLKSNNNNIYNKYEEICKLFSLFKSNIALLPLFLKCCKRNNLNLLYECILDIYLNEEIKNDKEKNLEDLIKLLILNASLPRCVIEYLCQRLSKFFRAENKFKLNEELIMKYLRLFHLCYRDNNQNLENEENPKKSKILNDFEEIGEVKKSDEVKNYFYFSGINSSMTLQLNNNSVSGITSFPSLENGLTFVFWINLDKQILTEYNNILNTEYNSLCINLIQINICEHQIKFILKESKYFKLVIDKNESSLIGIDSIFNFGQWVNICLIINKKTVMNPSTINIYINGINTKCDFSFPKEFPSKPKINNIKLFENLIGRVSSLLLFSFPIPTKLIRHFALHMKSGIYNNKILFKFLISNDNNYFKNANNYKYYEKYKNEKDTDKFLNILIKDQNYKNIICIFSPFSYERNKNCVDDIFGNYIGLLSENDGVNNYINHIKNIQIIGGISNLLPIAELMLKFKNSKNNIITEKSVLKYLIIFKDIIIGHSNNLIEAMKNNFFSNLGIFLERFPDEIYTNKILNILLDIGKDIFKYSDINSVNEKDNYINNILLNEKIFSKFNNKNQVKLWEEVNKFFISDYSKIKESLSINKICILLRFYDENRYNEHCCQKHANIIKFNIKSDEKDNKLIKNIMNPEMNIKTEKLFETIQLYINKIDEDTSNLYKLLLLDLSPCLQIKIIQIYINYFISKNIADEKKEITFNNLLKKNYLEISEYVLYISLLDVRIQILKLFKIIYQFYRESIKSFCLENKKSKISTIFHYIGANLFPDKLIVEINHDKKYKDDKDYISNKKNVPINVSLRRRSISPHGLIKKINKFGGSFYQKNIVHKDRLPLMKYINKEEYKEEKESLWRICSSWIIFEHNKRSKKAHRILKINNFAINFCMTFAYKKELPYIVNFLIILAAYFNDDTIINHKEVYSSHQLYLWLLDITFYYHNKLNIKNFTNKEDIEQINTIQKKTIEIFKDFLTNKNSEKNDFEKLIIFLFDYSLYIKNKIDEENLEYSEKIQKTNEISRITSNLLLISLESTKITNINTKICFMFLIYYKNLKLIINIELENPNKSINNINSINNDDINNNNDDSFEILDDEINNKNYENIEFILNNNIKGTEFENRDSLIPDYILDGINYDSFHFQYEKEDDDNYLSKLSQSICLNFNDKFSLNNFNDSIMDLEKRNKKKLKKNVLLKEIWKDFPLYDYIIDYYYANLWGLEKLCKNVKLEYDNKPTILIQKLYKEYSKNKKYKNILLEPILECLNISSIKNNDINNQNNKEGNRNTINSSMNFESQKNRKININDNINILSINLVLLSIAIEITNDQTQKEYLTNQYQQLLVFCILASINIKPSEKNYNLIQNELYNIMGYGCLFLKTKNETKYQQITNYLINPIYKDINESVDFKGIKKMLNLTKNKYFIKTAVFKLFSTKEKPKKDLSKTLTINSLLQSKSEKLRRNSFDYRTNLINNDSLKLDNKNSPDKDNNNIEINNNDNSDNINDNEIDITNYEIKPELQVNNIRRIDAIFNTLLNQFEKFDNNISENIHKIINKNNNEELIEKEKKRVFDEMKKLIPNYIEKLKKYSNYSYLREKFRRNRYKKAKIKLFSWRGFWSNKYLFFSHPEYLKLKIKNHYTKEMIKPILTPVLDIKYYLPNFKSFEKENLFNKNNYNYNINLDIDEILKDDSKSNSYFNNIESFNSIKNAYGFNYLECLYKMQDSEIWEYYKLAYEEKFYSNKNIYNNKNKALFNIKNKNRINKNNNDFQSHSFECCVVKVMNHIKGYIITRKNYFEFRYNEVNDEIKKKVNEDYEIYEELFSEIEDDISYDKDLGCCFGSIFQRHKRDKEKIFFFINYDNIKYMFIRNYYYRDTALEIYTDNNKSYYFNFKNKDELFLFISDITNNNSNIKFRQIAASVHDDKDKKKLLGYSKLLPSMKNKTYYISNKAEEWQNYNISTLEYLMWLNIYSGRSYNDLNQYPVFPWILSNYSNNSISTNDFRDLNLPIGMLEINEKSINRKNLFIEFYQNLKTEFEETYPDIDYISFLNKGQEYMAIYKKKKLKTMKKNRNNIDTFYIPYTQIPYNFGTHYSNPTYVSHFLSRIFPFSFISIEIHGNKFDDPERMFFSIEKTFESITTLKDDIRELIPEFYYFPEIFENINNLNLAQDKCDSDGNEIIINNVNLPPWSNNNSINFVLELRKYLESDDIHIHKWIDLIFGSNQRGENAEKINNIYMSYTYEKMIKIMEINDYDQRCALLRLNEMGVTPRNLFKTDSKPRIEKSIFLQKYFDSCYNFLEESPILDRNNLKMKKYNLLTISSENKELRINISPKVVEIKIINNENFKIFTNTNQYFNLNINIKTKQAKKEKKDEKKSNDEKQKIYSIENTSSKYAANYQINSIETPIIIYNNNKLMLKGGFWDGRIEINSINSETKEESISSMIFSEYGQPIVSMKMSLDEKILICGTKDGAIIIYEVDGKNLQMKKIIYSHSDEITSISINDKLNMFTTTSFDGYINIYILPSYQIVRVIHISSLKKKLKESEEKKEKENNINENEIIQMSEIIINGNININNSNNNEKNKNEENKKSFYDEEDFEEYKEDNCLYAENVFMSSSPLPCVVVFIANINIFRSYTINGKFINEIGEIEDSSKIFSPIIYNNLNFHEFLIYGTNNGYIKIRSFPKMNLINSIQIFDDYKIKTLTLSNDKKYCYAWGKDDYLAVITDNIISDFQEL